VEHQQRRERGEAVRHPPQGNGRHRGAQ
jgi:hypothetical protein